MKKLASVIILCFIFITFLNGEEKVFLDNNEIQEYKGMFGKWILVETRDSINYYSKKFQTPAKDIYKVNDMNSAAEITGGYIFFPYSEKYMEELKSKGITRESIKSSEDKFLWPLKDVVSINSVLGLRWGRFHPGLDMAAPRSTPIYASRAGLVVFSGYAGGYGLTVTLEHRDNYNTKYAHNSENLVKKGDFVKKGQLIAFVGSTGNSTGCHLHFEIRCNDVPLDPLDFLPGKDGLKVAHRLKNWK